LITLTEKKEAKKKKKIPLFEKLKLPKPISSKNELIPNGFLKKDSYNQASKTSQPLILLIILSEWIPKKGLV